MLDGGCACGEVWRALPGAQVLFEGILLKPSMVTPGADSPKREKPEVVADYTLKLLKRRVPPAVPGVRLAGCLPSPACDEGCHGARQCTSGARLHVLVYLTVPGCQRAMPESVWHQELCALTY